MNGFRSTVSDDNPGRRSRCSHDRGEAEVDDGGIAFLGDEDVGGFDISMNELSVAFGMKVCHALCSCSSDFEARGPVQWGPLSASVVPCSSNDRQYERKSSGI